MAKLNAEKRNSLPGKDFAGPKRSYPVNDANHARDALARSSGKPVHAAVVRKVEKKFPGIKVDGDGNVMKRAGRPRGRVRTSDGTMIRHAKR